MGIVLNILGGIIAGFFAAGIYEWIRRPRLDIALLPQMSLTGKDGSWVAIQDVRVTNRELPFSLRRFLRRSDAHSCYAWVILYEPERRDTAVSGHRYGWANWIPVYRHPFGPSDSGMLIPSYETVGRFIDIGSGGAAEIAIVEKATGESACFVAPWREELQFGKYVLKVEVGCSGSPPVAKWFLLENKGIATDPNSLVDNFAINELKKKEVREYLSRSKSSAKSP